MAKKKTITSEEIIADIEVKDVIEVSETPIEEVVEVEVTELAPMKPKPITEEYILKKDILLSSGVRKKGEKITLTKGAYKAFKKQNII